MELIHIGTQNCTGELRERLDFELRFLEEEGIKVKINEDIRGSITFFDCNIPDTDALFQINPHWANRSTREIFIHYLANALADIIIGNLEQYFVLKIVEHNYAYFEADERQQILEKAMLDLKSYSSPGSGNYLPQIDRKDRVLTRIFDYLKSNNELIIEGFIRFRLKDYFSELENAVERAVEDYMMEKEYLEFIRLLKYFVDIQEPKTGPVSIILREKGVFRLLDQNGMTIDNEYLEGFIAQMMENEVDYGDLLISALISIAPSRITVHFDKNHPVVETLNSIFGSRVKFCPGCELCEMSEKALQLTD